MASTTPDVPKRKRWLTRLMWCAAVLIVLVLVLYFVATSSAFLKGFVLPRVSRSLNADVTVSDASISPFSKVVLNDLKVTPKGAETLFTATSLTARYNLRAILGGHILVDEVVLASPTVTVIENADGTSNLTPLQSTEKPKEPAKPEPAAKPSAPPSLDLKSIRLDNATVRYVKNLKGGGRDSLELGKVNIAVANIKNGDTGKLDLSAAIAMDRTSSVPASNAVLQAKVDGAFTFSLTPDLKPGTVKGTTTVSIDKATGEFADLATLGAKLDCEVSPAEIKRLALSFTKAGAERGELRVSGPFDGTKMEGKLKVEVLGIDRHVLNLAGAANGIDFGTTTINTSNEIELAKSGNLITAAGTLNVGRLQILRGNQGSPTLDLRCDYNVSINNTAQSATLTALSLTGLMNQRPLLQMALNSPLTVAWGNTTGNTVGDATLSLSLIDLNLADWKAFTGDSGPGGIANLKLKLLSQQGGQQLTFDLDSKVDQLSVRVGNDPIPPLDVHLLVSGRAANLQQFSLSECRLEVAQKKQSMLDVTGTGTFDSVTQDMDVQVAIKAALDRLAALMPQTNVTCSAGSLELTTHATRKQQTQTVTGQLALAGFTGRYGDYQFSKFGTTLDLDLLMKGAQLEIRKANGRLQEGSFNATGNYDLDHKPGQITAKLVDFKENDLRPFLQPSLGEQQLVSVALNTTASAGFNAAGDATVKADVAVANLVVQDPKSKKPAPPLEARLQVDVVATNKAVAVHQCQLTLTPTSRANNVLRLTGAVDYAKTNAITGDLKLAAEALDLTAYYDLFVESNKVAEATAPAKPSTPAPATTNAAPRAPEKEPDAVTLPVRNFNFTIAIDRLYLREVDIAKWQAKATLDGGHIVLKPCQLTLNGAPVHATADLDLGVPGYRYDVTFDADKIPLAPLANTFSPTYSDKAKGNLLAKIEVKGAGTTGINLRKSLAGDVNLCVTNANIEIVGPKMRAILIPISLISGGSDLLKSPLDYIVADIHLGDGKITTRKFIAQSAAFLAESKGDIPIADVLTDSPLTQPIEIALSKQLGSKLKFTTTSTEPGYAKLPAMVRLDGTLGNPTAKTVLNTSAEVVEKAVEKTTKDLKKGLDSLFKKSK